MPGADQAGDMDARARLARVFLAAVDAVAPARLMRERIVPGDAPWLRLGARGRARLAYRRIWLVAAGKAAEAMAREATRLLGSRVVGGVVAAPRAARLDRRLRVFAGGHPLPNRRSLAAGRALWTMLGKARASDLVLVLLSGGASSLLVLPARGVTLAEKVCTNDLLLRSRAPIGEVNAVRKHLSRLKGGGLARRAGRARVMALLLSDVIGSSPAVIASGPTAADATTYEDAWRILERHGLLDRVPASVRRRVALGRRGQLAETLKPGECRARNVVVADNRRALAAAAAEARSLGFESVILTASLRGETRTAARRLAAWIRSRRRRARRICMIAGGETTVEVRGRGRGGRNQEFALVLAEELRGLEGVHCLSAGTDGRDGPTDAAGAFVDGSTAKRAGRLGIDTKDFLERNDSYGFFRRVGGLFRPGPTGTNVMDLKIAIIAPRGRR